MHRVVEPPGSESGGNEMASARYSIHFSFLWIEQLSLKLYRDAGARSYQGYGRQFLLVTTLEGRDRLCTFSAVFFFFVFFFDLVHM